MKAAALWAIAGVFAACTLGCVVVFVLDETGHRREQRRRRDLADAAYAERQRRTDAHAARTRRVSELADWTEAMPDLWAAFEADYRTRSNAS